jgi:hypothetical protein
MGIGALWERYHDVFEAKLHPKKLEEKPRPVA